MKQKGWIVALLLLCTVVGSFSKSFRKTDDWKPLFNGKDLTGWDTYLGPPLDDSGKVVNNIPVGLNKDPKHVFHVVKENGEKVIRISGEAWGGISTKAEYKDFHLQLKFKWGSLSWGQKKNKKKDSGLLYFATGPHGVDYGAWMRSQEFQIEEGNSGDYWGVAGGMEDITARKKSDGEYVYDPAGLLTTFSANSKTGRHCIKRSDAEKPSGQWNILDLYCHGDTSVHVINGVAMMVLVHSGQLENGQQQPLTQGKLQIQSEGAEVFYKDIKVKSLNVIPKSLLQ